MINNPYKAYKQQSFVTMTRGDMLTALYDGLLKELAQAKLALASNDVATRNAKLQKAQLILKHLQTTLDHQYEISDNLSALYDYFIYATIQVNIKQDPALLDEISVMIEELRATYIEADKISRAQSNH